MTLFRQTHSFYFSAQLIIKVIANFLYDFVYFTFFITLDTARLVIEIKNSDFVKICRKRV